MKTLACTAAAAAAVSATLGLTPVAAQGQAQAAAAAPLQLKRFTTVGTARRSASRSRASHSRLPRVVRMPPPRPKPPAALSYVGGPWVPVPDTIPLTPKAIPTVAVAAPAPGSADQGSAFGFAAEPTSSDGEDAFAAADVTLPSGVRIARSDEINEIDLAADAATKNAQQSGKSEGPAGVSLVTPANAAPPSPASDATPPSSPDSASKPASTSWLSWLYGKLVDGVLTVVLAIRSIFV